MKEMDFMCNIHGVGVSPGMVLREMEKPLSYHLFRVLHEMEKLGLPGKNQQQAIQTFVRMVVVPESTAKQMVRFAKREPWVFKCNPASRNDSITWAVYQDIFRKAFPYSNG